MIIHEGLLWYIAVNYHSHIIRESKLERANPKAISGDMGLIMSRLNLESLTLPKSIISGPSYFSSRMKFLMEATSTLPLKLSIYPPRLSIHFGFLFLKTHILSLF